MNDNMTRADGQVGLLPRQLWLAILDVYNYYLHEEIANYRLFPPHARPPQQVIEAVHTVNDWLDVALREGWIDGVLKDVD
jgi:hypothetical protein